MKKLFIFLGIVLLAAFAGAQTWIGINSGMPKPAETELLNGNIQSSAIQLKVHGYSYQSVATNIGAADLIYLENASRLLAAGAPDLVKVTASVIIPDDANMSVIVTSSSYTDFQNVNIAPSKGNLTRDIDPATVPYTYGPEYGIDQFYPGTLAELNDPYILRDFRGQTVVFYPFQYNPVTKVLRVYTDINVSITQNGTGNANVFSRTQPLTKIDREFAEIYKHHFLNYGTNHKYTPLAENGRMLVICHDAWMSYMQPFVNWKITEGIPCDIVSVTTAGGTAANIKNYVLNYYNTNGLTFLLLVGDAAQVPTITITNVGASDPSFGYLAGNDHYQEIFVGRFSAELAAHVQTQVERTLDYEVTPSSTPGKYNRAIGIASDQGPGDDNEYDYQHQRNLQTQLMGFTYTSKAELFDGSQGGLDATGNPTAAMLGTELNNGAGIITYTGHGSNTSFSTTGFSNTNISNLTNTNILPFIWSVACVNGNFTGTTCFAEAWMRHAHNNQPAGAVATLMSTINQSWNPPMEGQDEMVKILTENAGANIKRTFGGLSVNGIYKMLESYPSDPNMADTWTIFGDPSLMVRTDNPASMTVTHNPTITVGASNFQVNCNVPGAKVCLTINYQIIATAYVSGGVANLTFNPLTQIETITVCVTAFNHIPYLGEVYIVSSNFPNDISMESILKPANSYGCVGISEQPKVVIRNFGTNTLASATISYTIDGGSPVNYSWTGNLPQFANDTVTLPAVSMTLGSHVFNVYSSNPNGTADDNPANDALTKDFIVSSLVLTATFSASQTEFCTAPASVQFINQSQNALTYLWDFGDGTNSTDATPVHSYTNPGAYDVTLTASAGACGDDTEIMTGYIVVGATAPVVSDVMNCGPASFNLTASGNGTIHWYDAPTGGNLLHTGNTFTTPTLSATTNYYVEQTIVPPHEYVGKVDNTGGGGLHTNNSYYLIFNCTSPVVLKSVKVYAGAAGVRSIVLKNSSGTTLQSVNANLPEGESRVTLNFNIPVQNDLRLTCGTSNPNMYRNDGGIVFPYDLNGKISITGTNASPSIRYYYFYDWEIESPSCASARDEVTAYIASAAPVAGFNYTANGLTVNFNDATQNPSLYSWDFGDGNTSTDANPVHTYAAGGTYTVTLTVSNGCGTDIYSQQIILTTASIHANMANSQVLMYPNPAGRGVVYIEYSANNPIRQVAISNALGQLVELLPVPESPAESIRLQWNTAGLAPGVYYLNFTMDDGVITRKAIISD